MRTKTKSISLTVRIPPPIHARMLEHAENNGLSLASLVLYDLAAKYGISPAEIRRRQEAAEKSAEKTAEKDRIAAEKEKARLLALAKEPFPVPSQDGLFFATDEDWLKMDAIMDACRSTGIAPCWSEYELNYYNKKHP